MTFSCKNMNLYDLNKKLPVARQKGFPFIQINKLTIKLNSRLRYINISYYLKFQIPLCHRHFFRKIFQSRDYVTKFFNDMENLFDFKCQNWFNQLK